MDNSRSLNTREFKGLKSTWLAEKGNEVQEKHMDNISDIGQPKGKNKSL